MDNAPFAIALVAVGLFIASCGGAADTAESNSEDTDTGPPRPVAGAGTLASQWQVDACGVALPTRATEQPAHSGLLDPGTHPDTTILDRCGLARNGTFARCVGQMAACAQAFAEPDLVYEWHLGLHEYAYEAEGYSTPIPDSVLEADVACIVAYVEAHGGRAYAHGSSPGRFMATATGHVAAPIADLEAVNDMDVYHAQRGCKLLPLDECEADAMCHVLEARQVDVDRQCTVGRFAVGCQDYAIMCSNAITARLDRCGRCWVRSDSCAPASWEHVSHSPDQLRACGGATMQHWPRCEEQ